MRLTQVARVVADMDAGVALLSCVLVVSLKAASARRSEFSTGDHLGPFLDDEGQEVTVS